MATTTMISIDDKLAWCRSQAPTGRFAKNQNGNAIGLWDDRLNQFVRIFQLTLDGRWLGNVGGSVMLINGKPMDEALGTVWIE